MSAHIPPLWSAECDKIGAALVAFQSACPNVPKGETAKIRGKSKGGNDYEMEYSYADIAACLRHVRPHLIAAGLAVVQTPTGTGLATRVIHVSGQWYEGTIALPAPRSADDAQAWGSMITYFRRYALLATLGLAAEDEDDDGAEATRQARERPAPAARPQQPARAPAGERREAPRQAQRAPAAAARHSGVPLPEEFVPRFGQAKGRPIGEAADEQVQWLLDKTREDVRDPEKAKYRNANQANADTLAAVMQRREQHRTARRTGIQGPLDSTPWAAVLDEIDRARPDSSLDVGEDPAGLAGGDYDVDPEAWEQYGDR